MSEILYLHFDVCMCLHLQMKCSSLSNQHGININTLPHPKIAWIVHTWTWWKWEKIKWFEPRSLRCIMTGCGSAPSPPNTSIACLLIQLARWIYHHALLCGYTSILCTWYCNRAVEHVFALVRDWDRLYASRDELDRSMGLPVGPSRYGIRTTLCLLLYNYLWNKGKIPLPFEPLAR